MGYPTCPVFTRALQAFRRVSRNPASVTTERKLGQSWGCEHEPTGISGTPDNPHKDHLTVSIGHTPPESTDRRALKKLPVLLPNLVQDQLDCSHSRLWFNLVLKDLLWWASIPSSSNLFHCFISPNEKNAFLKPDISLLQFKPSISCPMSSF